MYTESACESTASQVRVCGQLHHSRMGGITDGQVPRGVNTFQISGREVKIITPCSGLNCDIL